MVIDIVSRHESFSSQDNFCSKIMHELDSAQRMLLQANSPDQGKNQMFIKEQKERIKAMNDLREELITSRYEEYRGEFFLGGKLLDLLCGEHSLL